MNAESLRGSKKACLLASAGGGAGMIALLFFGWLLLHWLHGSPDRTQIESPGGRFLAGEASIDSGAIGVPSSSILLTDTSTKKSPAIVTMPGGLVLRARWKSEYHLQVRLERSAEEWVGAAHAIGARMVRINNRIITEELERIMLDDGKELVIEFL